MNETSKEVNFKIREKKDKIYRKVTNSDRYFSRRKSYKSDSLVALGHCYQSYMDLTSRVQDYTQGCTESHRDLKQITSGSKVFTRYESVATLSKARLTSYFHIHISIKIFIQKNICLPLKKEKNDFNAF